MLCLLLSVGCSGEEEAVDIPPDEPVIEVPGQQMLIFGMATDVDLNLDGEIETLLVYGDVEEGASVNVTYLVDEQSQESVSELPGWERAQFGDEYRVIPDTKEALLAIYVTSEEQNEVFFYGMDSSMNFFYKGRIEGEETFTELGDIEIAGTKVRFGELTFEMDSTLPNVPLMYQDKNEALDYLDLPVYSIISGYGEPDMEEMVGTEKKLTYMARDLELFMEEDKIKRICTASGSLLDIEVGQAFLEENWRENERYALLELATSAEEYKIARFDQDKYFVECTLKVTEQGLEVAAVCVSLSELHQARLYEEHVLVDRFGDLLFAENEESWSKLLGVNGGWTQIQILGYERENAVLFFQAQKDGVIGVYHYNLLGEQVSLLAEDPQSAEFSGGLLSVTLADGRKYFDLGGMNVTAEIMGPQEEETVVEFYVQSDTLFYLPTAVEDYVVLNDLSQYLEREYDRYEASFDSELELGYLEAYIETGDQEYNLFLFLASEAKLMSLQEKVSAHVNKQVDGELRMVLTLMNDEGQIYECYDLEGAFLGLCDQSGNSLE